MIGVCIVTYNQEKYIAQAIESVLSQVDCGHKVVAYVGNDCSKDRTGEICHRYVEKFQGRVVMNLLDIMRKDGCKYIAMLDGDDYWCDDHKLLKQITYMDAHPEYGLVHTCGDDLWPDKILKDVRGTEREGDVSSFIFDYDIGNCTVLFKTELLDYIDFEEFQQQGFMSCDFIMYIIFSCHTQFGFLPDHTAIWRRGHDSVSNTNDMQKQIRYLQNDIAMWRYAAKLFPERWHATDEEVADYLHQRSFAIAFHFGDRKRALQEAALMNAEDRQRNKWKILAAHSALLTALWRKHQK